MATIKYKDENGQWQKIVIGGGTVEVDTEMSDTSENAVANKVIKAYVDGLVGDINAVLDTINGEEV